MLTLQKTVSQNHLFNWMNFFAPFAGVIGIISFAAVTWFGVGKEVGSWAGDFTWYYAGGKCFLSGSNMYALECVGPIVTDRHGYALIAGLSYPPHFAPLTLPIATLPYFTSSYLFYIANIVACLFMVLIVSKTVTRVQIDQTERVVLSRQWALLLVLGSTGIWAAVWLGQLTVFVAICLWMAFRKIETGNELAAALLLALASVKPQISVFVFLWLLLHRRYRVLALSAAIAGLLSLYAFFTMGFLPAIEGWLNGMGTYQDYPVNQLGNNSILGISSFLALWGVHIPIWLGMIIGASVVAVLRWKSTIEPFGPFALATILLIQMTIFSRPTDLIMIAPVFALFWPSARSNTFRLMVFVSAAALYCFPQQVVAKLISFPEAAHFRTLLLTILVIAFVRQMLRGLNKFDDVASLNHRQAVKQYNLPTV